MPEFMLLLMPERREPALLLFLKSTPMTARGRGRAAAGVQSSLCDKQYETFDISWQLSITRETKWGSAKFVALRSARSGGDLSKHQGHHTML